MNKKGITLIALVVTIIVMMVLAGIVLAVLNTDDNFISKALGTKKESVEVSIKEYVLSSYTQVITNPDLDRDPIDELEERIMLENEGKKEEEKFIIKSIDKENNKILVEHQGIEVEIDLEIIKESSLEFSSEDSKQKKYTVKFEYKNEQDIDQTLTLHVNSNQSIQNYLDSSQESIPQDKEWEPTLDLNSPVLSNRIYREKFSNVLMYTVNFDLDGGNIEGQTGIPSYQIEEESVISNPGTPAKAHHTFSGWTPSTTIPINKDTTFTAQWTAVTYTFTFNLNGGSIGGSTTNRLISGAYNTNSSTPGTPIRAGCTFDGWSPTVPNKFDQNRSFTAQWRVTFTFDNGRTTTGLVGTPSSTPSNPTKTGHTFSGWSPSVPSTFDQDRSFTATWTVITYTITYNLNGGTYSGSTANVTRSVEHGSMPPNLIPTRSGYTFNGWSPALATATANRTYTAQWTKNIVYYTITYSLNGGTYGGSTANQTRSVEEGTMPPNLTPTRTGHTFNGWSPSLTYATANRTYAAQWIKDTVYYTITYSLNGGTYSGSTANQTRSVEEGTMPPNLSPTRSGYTFSGWSPSLVYATANRTYTAQWTKNIVYYTITYSLNGGTYGGSTTNQTRSVEEGTMPPNLSPTRDGYTFGGWSPSLTYATANRSYTAQWNVITYTISYNTNGGSGTFASQTRTHGGAYVYTHSHSPTRSGYTFDGWLSHMRPDRLYPPNTPYGWDASTTMVAQWTKNTVYYTITYNLNGGTYNGSTANVTRSVAKGAMPPNLTPTRTNYKFQTWSPTLVAATANRTYTAQWKTVTVFYKITYKLAGGTYNGSTADVVREIEEGVMPPNLQPWRTNYTFNGWTPSIQKALAAKIYKAKWTAGGGVSPYSMDLMASSLNNDPAYHNITYDLNGGTYDGSTTNPISSVEKGSMPPDLTPTKNGYTFNGWSPSLTKVTGDKTYKAQWTPITYVITYNLNGGTYNGSTVNPIRDVGYNTMPPELIPTRNGYVFLEWSPNMTAVTENKTYIAVWSFPMILEMKKASLNEEILIPIEISRGNSAYISNNGGEYIKYTANNPTITNTVPAGEVFEVKIAGRINRIDYSNKPTEKQAQLYRILDWGELGATDFSNAFYKCTNLKGPIPLPGPNSFINVTSFAGAFYDCSSLTGIPTGLFDNCPNVTSFEETFSYCTALTGEAPALWLTHSGANGRHCFYYCTNLYNYSKIDSAWK